MSTWYEVVTLTPDEITNLENGLYYVNIVNSDYPAGEVRGQILPAGAPELITAPADWLVSYAYDVGLSALTVYVWGTDLSYQWFLNGKPVQGYTTCYFPTEGAAYVIVSNSFGSITSSVSYVSVLYGNPVPHPTSVAAKVNPANAGEVTGAGAFGLRVLATLVETATNNSYHFKNWTMDGKVIGTNNYVIVNSSNSLTVTANFAPNQSRITTTVNPAGCGTVTGNGIFTDFEHRSVTAKPHAGYLFSNWTENGQVVSTRADYSFVVTNEAALTANFASNNFLNAAGAYNGLFFTTNDVAVGTSGLLGNVVVGREGAVSGRLYVSGTSYALSGSFDVGGFWSNRIARAVSKGGPLMVEMNLDWGQSPPVITGFVAGTNGGPWTNAIYAERSGTAKSSGEFTVLVPPGSGPPGFGYALITNHAGHVAISGKLADGTAFSQSVPESASGDVPVFANLTGEAGLLLGWLNLSNGAPAGELAWVRPGSKKGLYPAGFTNYIAVEGSAWTNPPSHQAALTLTGGALDISGGPLLTNLAFSVTVSNNNALEELRADLATNILKGSIAPKTGLLTVTFGDGRGKATITGYGAALQNQTSAAGFFVTKTNGGTIILH